MGPAQSHQSGLLTLAPRGERYWGLTFRGKQGQFQQRCSETAQRCFASRSAGTGSLLTSIPCAVHPSAAAAAARRRSLTVREV
jgi:hypothetical protein